MRKWYGYGVGILALIAAGVALLLYVRGVNIPILEPAGPIALQERGVILITILLSAIVVIPVFVLLFFFAWKYRADSPHADTHHLPDWDHASRAIELTWWLVPTAIIAALSVVLWQSSHALDPYKPLSGVNPLTVEVVALDWKWLFIYPAQGIASVNFLEIPENVPVTFVITADAPMNSFWIPQLGGQIMAMPGMMTQLNLMASRIGAYDGFSANISGDGFAGMAFKTQAVSASDFAAWVQSVQASSTPLTSESYAALAKPSEYNPAVQYAPVEGNLYAGVVMKYMLPGGPMSPSTTMNSGMNVSASSSAPAIPPMQMMNGMP